MDKYTETFETWNKIANLYQEKFMNLSIYDETYDFICDYLSKTSTNILDIGCGPGNITHYLLTKRNDFQIQGIDIAPNMIELAKANNPQANFFVMDSRSIDQIESRFDAIICGFCIPYLSSTETEKLILDSSNLLNDNGLIYISFVDGNPDDSDFKVGNNGDRVFFNYHKQEYLEKNLVDCKFTILKIAKIEYGNKNTNKDIHTVLIAAKRKGN